MPQKSRLTGTGLSAAQNKGSSADGWKLNNSSLSIQAIFYPHDDTLNFGQELFLKKKKKRKKNYMYFPTLFKNWPNH